jgi:hypothetical protein
VQINIVTSNINNEAEIVNVTFGIKQDVEELEVISYLFVMKNENAIQHYPNLTHYLIFWCSYKKYQIFTTCST